MKRAILALALGLSACGFNKNDDYVHEANALMITYPDGVTRKSEVYYYRNGCTLYFHVSNPDERFTMCPDGLVPEPLHWR